MGAPGKYLACLVEKSTPRCLVNSTKIITSLTFTVLFGHVLVAEYENSTKCLWLDSVTTMTEVYTFQGVSFAIEMSYFVK